MMELKMLLDRRPAAIVIPLFYKISTEDLKSAKNVSRWRHVWREHADEWEQAIKDLRSFNGEVLTPGTSEVAYIKRVVRLICSLVASPILYDLSLIQGHQRFAQEVASQFEEATRQCDKVCMVGLYGVGGLGKTTMCKVMCNFYASQYLGKSHHIEFPSDGDDKKIVQECKKALGKLANLSDEHLLKNVDSFDQVVQLMKENLGRYDVFLAIDNVWEGSVEAATRMLGVSFSARSKILLTSRSEEVLKDLVRGHISNNRLSPLPCPDEEEAFQLFQQTFQLGDLNSLVINTNLLHSVLKTCFFSGNYHALALKAAAQHVKRECLFEGLDKLEHSLSHILQGVNNDHTILQKVDDLIKLNYVNLAADKQHMFLDIVVVVMPAAWSEVHYEIAHQWLSILYKKMYSKSTITKLISELALDGLIQLENKDNIRMIRVHDLYSDLAQREAARSSNFFTDRSITNRSLKEIQWERLERVILRDLHHHQCFIKELQQQECQNLGVLSVENIDLTSDIHLDLMPSLCVLTLESGNIRSIENWHDAERLAIVSLVNLHCAAPLKPIPSIPCLEILRIDNVKTVQSPPINLDGCQHLKTLFLAEASVFQDWKASYFSSLKSLEWLKIEKFNSITRVLNLNGLVNLQFLDIRGCESVDRIEGLDALKKLQTLIVQECPYLRNLDGLSGLTCLKNLALYGNKSMEEVVGDLTASHALKMVLVDGCEALKRMPNLSALTCLETLVLCDNKSMEEVVTASHALKEVDIQRCEALKRIPDLSGLTSLETLVLYDNKSMEEVVGGLTANHALKDVDVQRCEALKRMPDLSGLTSLEKLLLYDNKSMEEVVGGLTASHALKVMDIRGCEALKRMPDLSGLTCLEKLLLYDNKSMEEVMGGLSTSHALKEVEVRRCEALKRMLDLSGLTSLEKLVLYDNKSMEEVVGGLTASHALKEVHVRRCEALKRMPDLSALTSLETLMLYDNKSMEEVVGGLTASHALKEVEICRCEALKRMPDLSGLTSLEKLFLYDNKSMEKELVGDLTASNIALKEVLVGRCEALKGMLDLSGLTSLEKLELEDIKSMKEVVGGLTTSHALKELGVRGCEALKGMPDLSSLTCLEKLVLRDNKSMEEVVGVLRPTLKKLVVRGCEALQRMPDLTGLTCLEKLVLCDNKSVEEVVGVLSPTLKKLVVRGCEALKRMPDLTGLTCLEVLQVFDNKSMEEVVIRMPNHLIVQ